MTKNAGMMLILGLFAGLLVGQMNSRAQAESNYFDPLSKISRSLEKISETLEKIERNSRK